MTNDVGPALSVAGAAFRKITCLTAKFLPVITANGFAANVTSGTSLRARRLHTIILDEISHVLLSTKSSPSAIFDHRIQFVPLESPLEQHIPRVSCASVCTWLWVSRQWLDAGLRGIAIDG
jgi:hypothetical protein